MMFLRRLFLMVPIVAIISLSCLATPLNNVFDTHPIYTVFGADKYYKERDKGEIRIQLSPFYQQTSTSRDKDGIKVANGDRLGLWNMFGIFYGRNGSPTAKFFDPTAHADRYPNLSAAQTLIATDAVTGTPINTDPANEYHADKSTTSRTDLTLEQYFKPEKYKKFAYYSSVQTNYEKVGLRGQLNFDFGFGLGVSVKGGVVDIKNRPTFHFNSTFIEDRNGTEKPEAKTIYYTLYDDPTRDVVLKDLNLDLSPFRKTAAEDIHMQLYWHIPFDLEDKAGDVTAIIIPYFAVGCWFPTGYETDQNKPFSVPTGNDGYFGITADFSLGFDFPILPKNGQTLQWNLGVGILAFNERELKDIRVPTAGTPATQGGLTDFKTIYQCGLIPWKVNIDKRPGLVWHFSTSLKAENFIDGLSAYIDFVYSQHLKDSVKIKEMSATRKTAFENGVDTYKQWSSWKNQQIDFGLNYQVAEVLSIGGAVQAHISGVRVYRATTLLGSVTLAF